jgi:hypothetical protein
VKVYVLTISFCIVSFISKAQNPIKTHNHDNLIWLGYFFRVDLSDKWSVVGDYQFRRKDWFAEWSQKVFRQGVSYSLNQNVELTAGFVYLQHHKNGFIQNEFRPYQQVIVFNNFGRVKLDHRYRFEQRFIQRIVNNTLTNDFFFNNRVRYKVAVGIPIYYRQEKTRWMFYMDNELMVNFGEMIVVNVFDQNRFSLGIYYNATDNLRLQLGYMNIYAQKARFGHFDDADMVRFNIYHRIGKLGK